MTASLGRELGRVQLYRADIDGLRALAVLSVMFHRYLAPGFRGGFVGVDVFFVISGFLIAAHIESDIAAGRFSLLAFYERRIRRILPALFVMYALFLLLASQVHFPRDFHFQTRLAAYVIPFLANYAFYKNAGDYSGEFAAHIALLHTWSLAVEEQFYLFFPLLMIVISRFMRRSYPAVLWPMALASFLLCVVGTYIEPSATFYLTPFRAWELLAGALLAVGRFSPPRDARVRAGVALLGLLLIAGADLLLSDNTPYPSGWALVPCLPFPCVASCWRRPFCLERYHGATSNNRSEGRVRFWAGRLSMGSRSRRVLHWSWLPSSCIVLRTLDATVPASTRCFLPTPQNKLDAETPPPRTRKRRPASSATIVRLLKRSSGAIPTRWPSYRLSMRLMQNIMRRRYLRNRADARRFWG